MYMYISIYIYNINAVNKCTHSELSLTKCVHVFMYAYICSSQPLGLPPIVAVIGLKCSKSENRLTHNRLTDGNYVFMYVNSDS